MFPWTTGVWPWINYKSASIFYFIFFQGGLTEVPLVIWLACGCDDCSHWVKLKSSCIGERIVEIYQNHDNRPYYQEHYHSQHLTDDSIYFLNIGVKYWSLMWPPSDYDGINWAWITVWMLVCTSPNKIVSIGFGFSYDYGRNRWCGTRCWKQWNQYISRGKDSISDLCLNITDKVSTNNRMYLFIEGKSIWWCTAIQSSCRSMLLTHLF